MPPNRLNSSPAFSFSEVLIPRSDPWVRRVYYNEAIESAQ
jgi:hypothetical protein